MRTLDKINFVIATYGKLIAGLFNVRLWPPFLIYFLALVATIYGIYHMFSPILAGWLIPIVLHSPNNWFPFYAPTSYEPLLHYPQHLQSLPLVYQQFTLILSLFLESILTASAVLMFVAFFKRQKPSFGSAWAEAKRYYGRILVIWLVNVVLLVIMFRLLPGLFSGSIILAPKRQIALIIGMQALSTLVSSLLVYAIPYLILRNRTVWESFAGSAATFFRNLFTTYVLVGVPQLFLLPFIILLQVYSDDIIRKFDPFVILLLTLGLALFNVIVSYFTTGATVRFFLEASEE